MSFLESEIGILKIFRKALFDMSNYNPNKEDADTTLLEEEHFIPMFMIYFHGLMESLPARKKQTD
jgi:hypothetical protein